VKSLVQAFLKARLQEQSKLFSPSSIAFVVQSCNGRNHILQIDFQKVILEKKRERLDIVFALSKKRAWPKAASETK